MVRCYLLLVPTIKRLNHAKADPEETNKCTTVWPFEVHSIKHKMICFIIIHE